MQVVVFQLKRYKLLCFVVLIWCLVGSTNVFATADVDAFFEEVSAETVVSETQLQRFISFLDDANEEDFVSNAAELSRIIRGNQNRFFALQLSELVKQNRIRFRFESRTYHFLMVHSYDLMSFAEFQLAFDLLTEKIDQIETWQPISDMGRTAKANLLHIYGQLLVRKKRVVEALEYFFIAEAIFKEIDPQHPSIFTIQVILGEAFIESKNYQEALKYLALASEIFPKDRLDGRSYVAGLYAKAELKLGHDQRAHEIIHEYLQNPLDPREDYFLFFSLIHLDILQSLNNEDEYSDLASATYRLAEQIGNEDYLNEARFHLGYIELRNGNIDVAIALFNRLLTSDKNIDEFGSLEVYFWLAEAYRQRGDFELAYESQVQYSQLYEQQQKILNQEKIAEMAAKYQTENSKILAESALIRLSLTREKEKTTTLALYFFLTASLLLGLVVWVISIALIKLRRKNALLDELSVRDELTHVGNRLAMTRDTQTEMPKCVVLADIDYLKFYNDQFGHEEGDRLIKTFVALLKSHIDVETTNLYRIGGDEFVLTSQVANRENLQGIFAAVEADLKRSGFGKAGVSYGYAEHSEAEGFSKLLSLADFRMYESKANKRRS